MARKRTPFVYAKQSIVIAVGASPVKYRTAVVRDRRKDEMVEVPLHMAKPLEEENVGTHYVFASGERVPADHPAVKAKPDAFMTVAPDEEPSVA